MRLLVTGANGFAGSWLLRRLLAEGHELIGAVGANAAASLLSDEERGRVRWVALELSDPASVARTAAIPVDAVVHLAAVSSVSDSLRDPARTWDVNVVGTVRLVTALAEQRAMGAMDPVVLLVSTAEVYGPGEPRPRREADHLAPCSPYAASKAAAEVAGLEVWRRTGLRVLVARAFPHTGPGQSSRFVVPAFVQRIRLASRAHAPVVKTGNLEPVRDLLDVRDVVDAYVALLARGTPGEVYNVASGVGISLDALFFRIADLAGHRAIPERDPALARALDLPHLVGDPTKLRQATGWTPLRTLDQILRDVLDAQAD